MNRTHTRRRNLPITMLALGAGLLLVAGARGALSAPAAAAETARYNPAAKFPITGHAVNQLQQFLRLVINQPPAGAFNRLHAAAAAPRDHRRATRHGFDVNQGKRFRSPGGADHGNGLTQ